MKKREYYILAGDEGMKRLLIEKEINISPECLLIISENSIIGKLIKKKAIKEYRKNRKCKNISKLEDVGVKE